MVRLVNRPVIRYTYTDERSTIGRAGARDLHWDAVRSSNTVTVTRTSGVQAAGEAEIGSKSSNLRNRSHYG